MSVCPIHVTWYELNIENKSSFLFQITNANEFGGEDFVNFNAAGIIPSGSRPSSVNVTFTVWNDTIPENDEIFTFQLRITNGDGELARDTPSVGTVTIAANDDAFGRFSFTNIDLLGNVSTRQNLLTFWSVCVALKESFLTKSSLLILSMVTLYDY